MTDELRPIDDSRSKSVWLMVVGVIALVIGLVGVGFSAFMPVSTPAEGDGTADGAFQGGLIVASAVFVGVGALCIALAVVKNLRRRRTG